jgi:hypothetical protein
MSNVLDPLLNGRNDTGIQLTVACDSATAVTPIVIRVPAATSSTHVRNARLILRNLNAETIAVKTATDGNFGAALTRLIDIGTGKQVASAALTNGVYEIPSNTVYSSISLTKSAGVNPFQYAFACVTVPNN